LDIPLYVPRAKQVRIALEFVIREWNSGILQNRFSLFV